MENGRIFINATGQKIVRASLSKSEEWSIKHLLENKNVNCLTADPQNSNVIYAGTQNNGVFRSDDYGLTWTSAGLKDQWIKSLAVNRHKANIIYAGCKSALMFISMDSGLSWRELESFRHIPNRWWWFSPAEPPDFRPYVMAIASSPSDPDVLLAGIEFGAVVRSEDNGQSWSKHRRNALRDCHSLKFHSSDGQRLYQAGGTGGGAALSLDGGKTFQKKQRGLAKNYGVVCAADAEDPDIWYICVAASPFKAHGNNPESYLYRTTAGKDWEAIGWSAHPLPATATSLVTLPQKPGHLYAGLTSGDIWHSKDYGEQWEQLPFNLERISFSLLIL